MQPRWCQSDEERADHLSPWFWPLWPQLPPVIPVHREVVRTVYQREAINVNLLGGKVALFSAHFPLFLLFE